MPFGNIGRPAAALAAVLLAAPPVAAEPLSLQDSFPVGTSAGVLCSAQSMPAGPALSGMFDTGYSLVCRDAAVPVGQLYALRDAGSDPLARLADLRAPATECEPGVAVEVEGIGPVETQSCHRHEVTYRVYALRRGSVVYVAEGLAGYDSALRLGLRSLVADRVVEGEVSVATTGVGDPAAFARAQAGSLDPRRAIAEAYRRNNAGSYVESAEFFAALGGSEADEVARAEAIANEALQKSNLGRHAEADALFGRVRATASADPVMARRLRNYRTMHLLNQGEADAALAELDRPVPEFAGGVSARDLVIDETMAARLSAESPGAARLGAAEGLTEADRIRILDGQALQLRGTVLRLKGRDAEAQARLVEALDRLYAIRGGRIAATVWMRAQIHGELADIAEARGAREEASRQHQAALALLETSYPASAALLRAKGRLAAFLVRTGQVDPALALYREIVEAAARDDQASPGLARLLAPYFALLADRGDQPGAVTELFAASQVVVRPGVAQTQAILARELSGGSDEAARLFRQSVTLSRDIESTRNALARLDAVEDSTMARAERADALRASFARLGEDQAAIQSRLADFPRYRMVSQGTISLAELQALLREGEAYYKLTMAGDAAYAIFATAGSARAFRIAIGPEAIDREVDALRDTIARVEGNRQATYPFDLERAHALYRNLFGPVAPGMASVSHLIFEPDGGLLRLPANLLVTDDAGLAEYRRRAVDPEGDAFDFRGIAWLGRDRDVSTAVSPRAFRDVRRAPPSQARREYLGFGRNVPAQAFFVPAPSLERGGASLPADCAWPLAIWNRPISADELFTAGRILGGEDPSRAQIVIGEAFTDTAIQERGDLDDYRILHFATHGLVNAPRPECPVQPALLTSFGGQGSDGLLAFADIFDLRLDADLVILSACDTAAGAGREATGQAGLTGGGESALDGLVRAFVGAGARLVVASHWPVPDDFDATARLMSGLFEAPPGLGTAAALRQAQQALMDDPLTSHPYYWSGFAVVGDGAAPVVQRMAAADASMR